MPRGAAAQVLTERGFADGSVFLFPQEAPNDPTRLVGDLLFRAEVFAKPAPWVQFAAGLDARANSHDEVEDQWRLDFSDRGVRRPRLSVRRLAATGYRVWVPDQRGYNGSDKPPRVRDYNAEVRMHEFRPTNTDAGNVRSIPVVR